MDYNSVVLFVNVVNYGSFSETARRTGVPVATVSRRIAQLEKELGFRLLERSTRYLRLTETGSTFLEFATRGVEEFETGLSILTNHQLELSGTLRLSIPPTFTIWRNLLQEFQILYPKVKVQLFITARRVNLIEDGIDIALRIGKIQDSQAIATKLGEYRHLIVASPSFIKQYGEPEKPEELLSLPCASWYTPNTQINWMLGKQSIKIKPFFQVNDYIHLLDLALKGHCVTQLPPFLALEHLENGNLQHLLKDYPLPILTLNLLYPSRKQLSRLVKTYIEFCTKWIDDSYQRM
ncbi:MAG: LysR family transcriptional regulator [Cyanobacteria bacterium P01_A01_bin.40]